MPLSILFVYLLYFSDFSCNLLFIRFFLHRLYATRTWWLRSVSIMDSITLEVWYKMYSGSRLSNMVLRSTRNALGSCVCLRFCLCVYLCAFGLCVGSIIVRRTTHEQLSRLTQSCTHTHSCTHMALAHAQNASFNWNTRVHTAALLLCHTLHVWRSLILRMALPSFSPSCLVMALKKSMRWLWSGLLSSAIMPVSAQHTETGQSVLSTRPTGLLSSAIMPISAQHTETGQSASNTHTTQACSALLSCPYLRSIQRQVSLFQTHTT